MTSHDYTESATPGATKRYGSDLNDQEFALLAPTSRKRTGRARNERSTSAKC